MSTKRPSQSATSKNGRTAMKCVTFDDVTVPHEYAPQSACGLFTGNIFKDHIHTYTVEMGHKICSFPLKVQRDLSSGGIIYIYIYIYMYIYIYVYIASLKTVF
jgi:hypothetical protein